MTERTWAPADEGDVVEQGTEAVPGAQPDAGTVSAAWEADEADLLEQAVEVGDDDERDPPA